MNIHYPKELILKDLSTGQTLTHEEYLKSFHLAIQQIQHKFPDKLPRNPQVMGVQAEFRNDILYLVPSFNGIGAKHLSCEFTFILKHLHDVTMPLPSVLRMKNLAKVKKIIAKAKTPKDVIDILLEYGTLYIGSIGSRVTNHASSCELHFKELTTEFLRNSLVPMVNITNEDARNKEYDFGFFLTRTEEVVQFCDSIGLKDKVLAMIEDMHAFEKDHDLENIYRRNDNRIHDKDLVKMVKMSLREFIETEEGKEQRLKMESSVG